MIYKALQKHSILAFCLDGVIYFGSFILLFVFFKTCQVAPVYWAVSLNVMIPLFYFYHHFFRISPRERETSFSGIADMMRWIMGIIAFSHISIGLWSGTQVIPFREQFLGPLWQEEKGIIVSLAIFYLLSFVFWQILFYLKRPLGNRKSEAHWKQSRRKHKDKKRKRK